LNYLSTKGESKCQDKTEPDLKGKDPEQEEVSDPAVPTQNLKHKTINSRNKISPVVA
jgi:hypothetical protein